MSMSTKRLIVLTMLISTSLLIFSPFQALGYSADSKLNISRCEIKDQTLFYEGSFSDKRPITIMARNKENPLDIRYMRIITPVSYTHLDVYKRQQLHRKQRLNRQRTILRQGITLLS